jgi:DNA (cytosine-5)-methyltransferase 1
MRRIARGIQKFVIENPEPFIINYKFQNEPENVNKPMSTITAVNSHYLVAPMLVQYHGEKHPGEVRGQQLELPLMTLDTSNRYGMALAFLSKSYGGGYTGAGSALIEPVHTVTAVDHNHLITAYITKMRGTNIGQSVEEPLQTITAGGLHFGEVKVFLVKYYGQGFAQGVDEPLHAITAKDRFGPVKTYSDEYVIADIHMRMLQPHELFAAQGFPADYIIDHDSEGKHFSKSQQVARCGNAVTPQVPAALVRANLPEYCQRNSAAA